MIDTRTSELPDRVQWALAKCAEPIEQCGPDQWDLSLKNGSVLPCRATLNDQWLHLDVDIDQYRSTLPNEQGAWSWLLKNGILPSGVKYALDAHSRLRIRAETPLPDNGHEFDLCGRIATVWEGLGVASAAIHGPATKRGEQRSGIEWEKEGHQAACDLRRLCEEAGWPFTERSEDKLAVTLDASGDFWQALVERRTDAIRVAAPFGALATASDEVRNAVAVLLLTLNGVLRFARAAGEEQNGQVAAHLEALLPHLPSAEELGHALSAISVGCRLCGREVEVLQNDLLIAREYLAVRGWSSP
jgi:hypothetical protein